MFRRLVHILIVLILLVSTTGITISKHYCGGELVSTFINHDAKSCCDDDGCCENKTLHFELEDDYMSPIVLENNTIVELDVLFPILFVLSVELLPAEVKASNAFYDASPPPKIQTALSLRQTYLL